MAVLKKSPLDWVSKDELELTSYKKEKGHS